jgi:L-lysine exporter family protein LysE/ArgO
VPALLLALVAGFGTGLSLIVAIGAQNAFVLRQGIRREAVLLVVSICAVSDAVLIGAGVGGVGAVVEVRPEVLTVTGLLGGVFLLGYGLLALRRAIHPGALHAEEGPHAPVRDRRHLVVTCLALTWLNPHVYLDTVLVLGSVATGYGSWRWMFGVGAGAASVCWFAGMGFGARLLRGFFARPGSWRLLDGVVAATMATLGTGLLLATPMP